MADSVTLEALETNPTIIKVVVTEIATAPIPGPTGKSAWQYAVEQGYTGTEEEFAEEQAGFAENAQLVEQAKVDAVDASQAAAQSEINANDSALAASGSATSASNSATAAGSAKDQAIVAKNAAELAAATIDKNGEVAEGDIRLVNGGKVFEGALSKSKYTNGRHGLKPVQKVVGKYINGAGQEVTSFLFSYIVVPIPTQESILFIDGDHTAGSLSQRGACFDSSGQYIGSISETPNLYRIKGDYKKAVAILPYNTAEVRLSFATSVIDDVIVYTSDFIQDSEKILTTSLDKELVAKSEILIYNVLKSSTFYNWLDFAYLRAVSGVLSISPSIDISSTGLIPINPGDNIVVRNWISAYSPSSMSQRGCWYDENKRLIGGFPTPNLIVPTYTAVPGAKFFNVTFESVKASALSVEIFKASTSGYYINHKLLDCFDQGIAGSNWSSFGDSITFRNEWQPALVSKFGLVHTNLGIGNTCMINTGPTPMCSAARIQAIKDSNPSIITILAGANDIMYCEGGSSAVPGAGIGTESELSKPIAEKDKLKFFGAYSVVIENLLSWKPTLRIIILGTTWAHNDGKDLNSTLTYTQFSDASKRIAAYYGFPFVDLHGECGFNRYTLGANPYNIYSNDQIHPNTAGAKRISEVVDRVFSSIKP